MSGGHEAEVKMAEAAWLPRFAAQLAWKIFISKLPSAYL